MTSLIIISYNRPEYFTQCLDSLRQVKWLPDTEIIMIDDASTDEDIVRLFNEFTLPGIQIMKIRKASNKGIKENLITGYDMAFAMGAEIAMNLDSDAIVKPDFFKRVIELKQYCKGHIVTGFHSVTKNKDGSDRHPILATCTDGHADYYLKKSVGGINMCMSKSEYEVYCKPALLGPGNWDHNTCINAERAGFPIACAVPSVVQHIGINSSMNHAEEPDRAADFISLSLPDVTLIGADTNHFDLLQHAAEISQTDIEFGAVKLLKPESVKSGADYNKFCMKEFGHFVETDFAIVIQWDGYILNWRAWNDQFKGYDYIGAPWIYCDNMNVGNGGFSFRSKKLMDILGKDEAITQTMPEDYHICRTYRPYLEKKYGIKFAPEEIAHQFSIEAHGRNALPGANKYNGAFGFHGFNVDYTGSGLSHIPSKNTFPTAGINPMHPAKSIYNRDPYARRKINII